MIVPRDERYSRQRDIVPFERTDSCRATIVGVGAIGRQVALQLTAIGLPWLQLIDPDIVEPSNLASQGYLEEDLGKRKVEATTEACGRLNSNIQVLLVPGRFRRSMEVASVVFCCVDTIDARRLIWDSVKDSASFFGDGRMTAEVLRVLTACDYESRRHYPTTLFRRDEVYAGSCTAKTTIYCANVAAGLMVAQFAKYLRRLPLEADFQLNLLAAKLSVAPAA